MNKELEEKIAIAVRKLSDHHNIYYYILRDLERQYFTSGPIAGIGKTKNNKIVLFMNLKYIEVMNSDDVAGILEHEIQHLILQHLTDIDKKKDHSVLNRAMDYIINDSCKFIGKRYKELKEIKSPLLQGCLKPGLDKLLKDKGEKPVDLKRITSNELYDVLIKYKDDLGNYGENLDDHSQLSDISEQESQEIIKKAASKLDKDDLKKIGNLPANIQNVLKDIMKTKSNFKQNLMYFYNVIKSNQCKKTFMKLNKRYPFKAKGRRQLKKPSICLAFDTSGSMLFEEYQAQFKYELSMYLKVCDKVWLVMGDTRETSRILIKKESDIDNLELLGGGGTNLQFAWNFAKEKKLDGIIVHTDGYIPEFNSYKIKTMFALYEGGKKVEGYKNVFVL
jgi:predicted metal-dependent peptidase